MLMLVPLDELVTLTVTYEVPPFDGGGTFTRAPFSRSMTLRAAILAALNCRLAKASITARGITYRDPETFRRISARRDFMQKSQ